MVKVVEKTKEEIEYENKINNLEKIAELTIPFKVSIKNLQVCIGIFDYSSNAMMFNIYSKKNEIAVFNKDYFDNAFKVAEEYEKQTNSNWTLKKQYNE